MSIERYIGVDLAWAKERGNGRVNETGLIAITSDGDVFDAGWANGLAQTLAWIEAVSGTGESMAFVDAPLVVDNESGQRLCETQVGQRYGRWRVSANSTGHHAAGGWCPSATRTRRWSAPPSWVTRFYQARLLSDALRAAVRQTATIRIQDGMRATEFAATAGPAAAVDLRYLVVPLKPAS